MRCDYYQRIVFERKYQVGKWPVGGQRGVCHTSDVVTTLPSSALAYLGTQNDVSILHLIINTDGE